MLLKVSCPERDEASITNILDLGFQRPEQEFTNSNVVNELSLVVDHVNNVDRLAVAPVCADEIEDLLYGPVIGDRDEVGSHEPAHAPFRIIEQLLGYPKLLGREQAKQFFYGRGRKFLEQGCPVVRRHLVDHPGHILATHRVKESFLVPTAQILKGPTGEGMWDDAEDHHLVLVG